MNLLVQFCRWFVGILFIFSGLVKLNDPVGFSFKLDEYFSGAVLGLEFLQPFVLPIAIFLVILEVILGLMLLIGFQKKFTVWSLLLMILFFTFLTFYSAYFNKVTDCGCFGDAIPLTPWQSFGKDVLLLFMIVILFMNVRLIQPLFKKFTIKITPSGKDFLSSGKSFMMSDDHTYNQEDSMPVGSGKAAALDAGLVKLLKSLRKKVADQKKVPPYVVFQDPSLDDMATKYPITLEEMANIHGVGDGKARKFGKPFIDLISRYVDDNEITRADDMVIKSTGTKSGNKLYFITSIDRKLSFDDIADAKGMEMSDLINELESIVYSGTRLNLGYWVDEVLDEDQQEELHEYFLESQTDGIDAAMEEFDGDYEEEEIRLYRLKFISEVGN